MTNNGPTDQASITVPIGANAYQRCGFFHGRFLLELGAVRLAPASLQNARWIIRRTLIAKAGACTPADLLDALDREQTLRSWVAELRQANSPTNSADTNE